MLVSFIHLPCTEFDGLNEVAAGRVNGYFPVNFPMVPSSIQYCNLGGMCRSRLTLGTFLATPQLPAMNQDVDVVQSPSAPPSPHCSMPYAVYGLALLFWSAHGALAPFCTDMF